MVVCWWIVSVLLAGVCVCVVVCVYLIGIVNCMLLFVQVGGVCVCVCVCV